MTPRPHRPRQSTQRRLITAIVSLPAAPSMSSMRFNIATGATGFPHNSQRGSAHVGHACARRPNRWHPRSRYVRPTGAHNPKTPRLRVGELQKPSEDLTQSSGIAASNTVSLSCLRYSRWPPISPDNSRQIQRPTPMWLGAPALVPVVYWLNADSARSFGNPGP